MKTLTFLLAIVLSAWLNVPAFGQPGGQILKGQVLATDGTPLPGAVVRLKDAPVQAITNATGSFSIATPKFPATLIITFTGYVSRTIAAEQPRTDSLRIYLEQETNNLTEVTVSTGYQQLPRERATGSFVQVDKALLNRRVSTDIISRLENVTPGLTFNRDAALGNSGTNISIRGQSTLFANTQPLIVIDNFPYDGNINNINPNDVESITVLKDAAAASIWGSRAGNGVIVITTKKGKYKREMQVSFNANTTVGQKPDLYYQPQISPSTFIDIEKGLFEKGYYQSIEQSPNHQAVTPVVELLIAARDGKIPQAAANEQIDALRAVDVRQDLSRYFYQRAVNQQYSLSLNGGSDHQRYFVAGGYDHNQSGLTGNAYERMTLNANSTYAWFNHQLELTTGIFIGHSKNVNNNPGITGLYNSASLTNPFYPYARLAGENGEALSVVRDYRTDFTSLAISNGLLDWSYRPLEELQLADNRQGVHEYRLNGGLTYKLPFGIQANILYQYNRLQNDARNYQSPETYYTRSLINQFSSIGTPLSRPVPLGGILDRSNSLLVSQSFRGQLNYEKAWQQHRLNAIAGYEVKDAHTVGDTYRLYGYDPEYAASSKVDYVSFFNRYDYPGASSQIPNRDATAELNDRYRSYYANAGYSYLARYVLSASIRKDESNLFGVNTNQKGVPLWSAGLAWNVSEEPFYPFGWLPYLKARFTYGYNGNVYKNVSAYTTATYFSNAVSTQLPYATIRNPPNPELRWEKVKVVNLGIDFGLKGERVTGTIEYYDKKSTDLIGTTPFAPSTGITTFTGNNAAVRGKGVDVVLHTINATGKLRWQTSLLFSRQTDKVLTYNQAPAALPGIGTPVVGHPINSIYSYAWAGLDPNTGDPQGLLNNAVSKDYVGLLAAAANGGFVYNGPARPTTYGALRNTWTYGDLSLSANISYRLGYYYRAASVSYAAILSGAGGHSDYNLRWQQPGDERQTTVPSVPASIDVARDDFYQGSSVLVKKADNIRLEDVNVSYEFNKARHRWLPMRSIQLYLYANHLGILWKADKGTIDPDYSTSPYKPARTLAIGLKAEL